jgi:hypothetical protein
MAVTRWMPRVPNDATVVLEFVLARVRDRECHDQRSRLEQMMAPSSAEAECFSGDCFGYEGQSGCVGCSVQSTIPGGDQQLLAG